jgi:hypothetical protein
MFCFDLGLSLEPFVNQNGGKMSTIKAHMKIHRETGMDDDALDALTRNVLTELRELDLENVELAMSGQTPYGSKSSDTAIAIGTLFLAVLPSAVPKLIEVIGNLASRIRPQIEIVLEDNERKVAIKFTPSEESEKQIAKALELARSSIETQRIQIEPL